MATVLTHAIIENARETVDAYVATSTSLYDEVMGIIANLTGSNFSGDAAEGYKYFFTQQVTPALTDNLTAPNESLMAGVRSILDTIEAQLLNTVDPQLGENNRNPGGNQ